jgi:fermentation-respiration switch protein FrsA (DUF1100 family)
MIILGIIFVAACVGLAVMTRAQAYSLVTHPAEERRPITETPADYGLPYEEVTVTTEDGLKLAGWYVPSENCATVIAQHGYKGDRQDLLLEADFLHRHGYGVLLTSMRAHDQSDGELFTFGKDEMQDFEAWYQYLLTRDDVDPDRIGIIGESMGGALSIKYSAENSSIKALVAHSAFSSLDDTVEIGVQHFTGLPPFPFAPMILFWAERETGVETSDVNAKEWIKGVSPRPVFILQGGADDHVSVESGEWLYEAAGEPKELWFEAEAVHHGFDEEPFVEEYERRVVAFYDRHLLGE